MFRGLYFEEYGNGEPVLLLNGVMMTTSSWAQQRRALQMRHRVVLHDFRGQLRSEPLTEPIALQQHVDDLLALLDHLDIPSAHLIGTSYGGEIGMMFAAQNPQRVRSLAVIASVLEPDNALKSQIDGWADIALRAPERLWDATMRTNYSPEFLEDNPVFIEAARQRFAALPPEWFGSLVRLCAAFNTLQIDPTPITAPTLVIAAERDELKPLRYSEEIARRIDNARLEVVAGAGHAVVIEAAAEVNERLLRFLEQVER